MLRTCRQENCTVADTNVCLLNNDPEECPNRTTEEGAEQSSADLAAIATPPLSEPSSNPTFPNSLTLSPAEAGTVMRGRYCKIVGVLGPPDAGKTALLVSLYLLLAKGRLEGFSYRDSRSLMAFDELSQGARRWNGGHPPEQMTNHTELSEGRAAGFLHLELESASKKSITHYMVPDLPGEWSTTFIDSNRSDRLSFLHRADVIWLTVDGVQLATLKTRQLTIHRMKLLIGRLADMLHQRPKLIIVVTRADFGPPPDETTSQLRLEAQSRGFDAEIALVASFGSGGKLDPGHGISDLIRHTDALTSIKADFWPDADFDQSSGRAVGRLRVGSVNE